jgi:hypothetical protein
MERRALLETRTPQSGHNTIKKLFNILQWLDLAGAFIAQGLILIFLLY